VANDPEANGQTKGIQEAQQGSGEVDRAAIRADDTQQVSMLKQLLHEARAELARLTEEQDAMQCDAQQRIDEIAKLTSEVLHERDKVEVMAQRADRYLARAEKAEAESHALREALAQQRQVCDELADIVVALFEADPVPVTTHITIGSARLRDMPKLAALTAGQTPEGDREKSKT
jgi:chromosome segregation ATPase